MFSIPSTPKKRISGIRRTQDGILYLWHILCWSPASQEANSRGWRVENARHTKKLHKLYIRESPQHDKPNSQPDHSSDDLMVRQWRGTMKIGRKEAKTSQMPWRGSDCYEREETMMSLANNLLGLFVLHWLAGWLGLESALPDPPSTVFRPVSHLNSFTNCSGNWPTTRPTKNQSHDQQMHFREIAYNVDFLRIRTHPLAPS